MFCSFVKEIRNTIIAKRHSHLQLKKTLGPARTKNTFVILHDDFAQI